MRRISWGVWSTPLGTHALIERCDRTVLDMRRPRGAFAPRGRCHSARCGRRVYQYTWYLNMSELKDSIHSDSGVISRSTTSVESLSVALIPWLGLRTNFPMMMIAIWRKI